MVDAALHLPASFLHEAFSDRSGVPLEFFELYYCGKRLEGEAALSSWGVGKGSTIEVKMRGRGGGSSTEGEQPQIPEEEKIERPKDLTLIFIFGTCIAIIFEIIIFEIIFGAIIFEIIMDVSRVLLLAIFVFVWWHISTCHAKFYVKRSGSKDDEQEERDEQEEKGEEKGEEIDELGGLLAVFVLVVLWNWALPFILNDDK